jgi:N-formylglutamate deformylase
MNDVLWRVGKNEIPLIATAIHDGHSVREEVARVLRLSDSECLREEDPHTGRLAKISPNYIIPGRSRFEVDLNRPREKAVYVDPEDAWGLHVWKERPTAEFVNRSLSYYDAFYAKLAEVYAEMGRRFGKFIVYDLHSYNHRRDGPENPPADPEANPEVNVGTGTMDRDRWAGVVDRFIRDLGAFESDGRKLDVRENVKFFGGNHPNWSHQNFSESACVIAVEFKKVFMDEWTGEVYAKDFDFISNALLSTFDGVQAELRQISTV